MKIVLQQFPLPVLSKSSISLYQVHSSKVWCEVVLDMKCVSKIYLLNILDSYSLTFLFIVVGESYKK